MAADPKGGNKGPEKDPGSNAIDGLTPPTMKYAASDEGERTQIGPAPSGSTPSSLSGSKVSRSAATITGNMTGINPSLTSGISAQDLSTERLLRDAPRIDANGQSCPALGKIPLLAKIGQGGMGAVYYGIHPRLQSEVAVKVLPFHLAEQDPGMIKRFYREAQIAAMVRSPHLVNVMDVNEESGLFFLVMEYVPGKTAGQIMKAALEEGKPGLSELDVLNICIAATAGLVAAHSSGIVHRDLKPENIMIPYINRHTKEYDLKRSKLMDLGLARNEESNQSLTGVQAAMGTPGYMAPEQALDAKTADKRSDVFGMGATMYALLCGKPPFRGEAIMKVLMATMHEPHEPVIKVRSDISPVFSEIIDKCLDKKQDNRFQDAQQLLKSLRHCRKQTAPAAADDDDDDSGEAVTAAMSSPRGAAARTVITPSSGSSIEKTLLTMPDGSPVKKSKAGLIAAGAAALVLVAGGAFFALRGGGGGGGTDPVDPKKPPQQLPQFSEPVMKMMRRNHSDFLTLAQSSIKAGDVSNAEDALKSAKEISSVIPEKDLQESEQKVVAAFEGLKKTRGFEKELKQIDAMIQQRDLDGAYKQAIKALSAAPDEATQKLADDKKKAVEFYNRAKDRKDKFVKIMQTVSQLADDKIDTTTSDKLEEARKLLPSDDEVAMLKKGAAWLVPDPGDLASQETKVQNILGDRQKDLEYKQLVDDANSTTDDDKKYRLASKAKELRPDRAEAKKLLADLDLKLDASKRKLADEDRKKEKKLEYNKLFADAQALQKNDIEKALSTVKKALEILPDEPEAVALQATLSKAKRDKQERDTFEGLIQTAQNFITNGENLDQAEKTLKDVAPAFEKEQALADIRKQITDIKERAKKKKQYEGLVQSAKETLEKGDLEGADKLVTQAEALDPKATGASFIRGKIQIERDKALALKNKKDQFDGFIKAADSFEKSAEALAAGDDKVSDYQKALDRLQSAKDNAAEGDTAVVQKRVADISAKLEKAKTEAQAAKLAAATRARIDGLKAAYPNTLADADSKSQTDIGAAIKVLTDFKKQLTDPGFDTEIKNIDVKIAAYNAAVLQPVKDKISSKDLGGALRAFQNVPTAMKDRPDVRDMGIALGAIQGVATDIQNTVQGANGRIAQASKRLKSPKGDAEKAKLDSELAGLQALPANALSQFAGANFKDANVTSGVKADKDRMARDIEGLLQTLERLSKESAPPDHGNEHNVDDSSTRPRQPEPKKTTRVGEGDLDN